MARRYQNWQLNQTQLLLGIVCLILGILFYGSVRPPGSVYLISSQIDSLHLSSKIPLWLGNSFPTFIHVCSFSLITGGVLGCSRRCAGTICLGWFITDLVFELGQQRGVARWIADKIPIWFEHFSILDKAKAHFIQGTFDPFDLLSIALGSIIAYFLLVLTEVKPS